MVLEDWLALLIPEKRVRTLAHGEVGNLKVPASSPDEREERDSDTGSSDGPKFRTIDLAVTEQRRVAAEGSRR